jgi:stage II sporulation protein D
MFEHLGADKTILDEYNLKLKVGKRAVPRDVFYELYDYLAETTEGINKINITVAATPGTVEDAKPWTVYTDKGVYTFYGLFMDGYLDNEVSVYTVGDEIVAVKDIVSKQVTYRNVWIYEGSSRGVRVYLNGIDRTFYPDSIEENISEVLGDLMIDDGVLSTISVKSDRINGKVLSVTDEYVEIEGYGRVSFDSEYRLFNNYNGFSQIGFEDILVGYELEDFIVADGMICGVIVNYPFEVNNIRVMIRNSGFESIYHDSVAISCKGDYYILSGNELENRELVKAGTDTVFDAADERILTGRVRIATVNENDRIGISSIERNQGVPEYPGIIEISCDSNGLYIVDEVDIEQYLKLVVPSEMPAGYGIEAAKVQAVCARSYAYNQLLNNDYREYGAHIDDSTLYQVYNNTKEYEVSSRAVDETRGQVMTKDGSVVTAYYYSTSCGYGSDISIWGQDSASCSYIKAHGINPQSAETDLTDNEVFYEFITNVNEEDFDSSFALYRWHTTLTLKQINSLYKEKADVGDITSIEITERLNGGIVNKAVITGTKGTREITGEGSIRKFFGDSSIIWINNSGNEFSMSSIPSAFISLKPVYKKNALTGYEIYGGGFGHGLGMSQNGAYAMTKAGYLYEDILKFFYDGVEVETIY